MWWKWWPAALGAAAAFALSYLVHSLIVAGIETRWESKLADQKQALEEKCKEDQAVTKGANDELQKKYHAINRRLAEFKRMQQPYCVITPAGKTIFTPSRGEHAGQDGISSYWLIEYAAECEQYRSQRIVLEKFIDDAWQVNRQ